MKEILSKMFRRLQIVLKGWYYQKYSFAYQNLYIYLLLLIFDPQIYELCWIFYKK